jgi:tetratricopeptide (TPR) repeat protein
MARSARSYRREAEQLRAAGWTYRRIAAEWRQQYGFNSRVAFRLAHELTQADVAKQWNEQWPDLDSPKTAKQISYWEIWPGAGGRCPSVETLNRLAYLYQCSAGELLDGEDYSHLDSVHASHPDDTSAGELAFKSVSALLPASRIGVVTEAVVADFETLTDAYRRLDYRDGAQTVSADVAVHLRRMLEVSNRTSTTAAYRRVLRAVGDAAQLAAWLAIDGQRYEQARGYCQLALSVADKANDRALHAYTLGVVSYIHLHGGDSRGALRVLGTAQELATRGVPAAVTSWLGEAAGEAHGLAGEGHRGLAALAEAERAFDAVTVDNTPAWLTFFNADCHAARLKGRCLMRLRRPREAVGSLYEALTLLPAHFVRERSGTLIDLAYVYTQMRQIEHACDVATQADILARRTGSERNRKRLRQLLCELMPWTHLDCVQSLYRQVLLG